jgi:hypothetical protein
MTSPDLLDAVRLEAPGIAPMFLAQYDGQEPTLHRTSDEARVHCDGIAAAEAGGRRWDWSRNEYGDYVQFWVRKLDDARLDATSGYVSEITLQADGGQEQGKDTAHGGESTPLSAAAAKAEEIARAIEQRGLAFLPGHPVWPYVPLFAGIARGKDVPPRAQLCGAALSTGLACPEHQAQPLPPLLVYRVDYDGHMPCGWYSNIDAARAHCESVVSDEHPADVALFFEWCVVDDSAVIELDVRIGDESRSTLYTITTLTVEHAFDPDAES